MTKMKRHYQDRIASWMEETKVRIIKEKAFEIVPLFFIYESILAKN
jgi:hypothetical protein